MKNLFLVLAAMQMMYITGCEKDNFSKTASKTTSLTGTWELRQLVAQIGTIDYVPGNYSTIQFTGNTYVTTDTLSKVFINQPIQGLYQTVADASALTSIGLVINDGEFTNRLIINNDTLSDKIFYQLNGNQLILLSGYFPTDGGVKLTYVRK